MLDKTLEYYNKHVDEFVAETLNVDFTKTQDKFLCMLQKGDYILDFGCGSGRDTKYFLEHGMRVDAMAGSQELCKMASEYTGVNVTCALFQELNEIEKYDGIWACSSILHLQKKELILVFQKMISALKPDGILYASFKYGEYEGMRNGRYFTDFTKETFHNFLQDLDQIHLCEDWITGDVRSGREGEKWLNLILKKRSDIITN